MQVYNNIITVLSRKYAPPPPPPIVLMKTTAQVLLSVKTLTVTNNLCDVYKILSLASKTLSPLLFCYAEFYGRGEGSSNSCNIPCTAAHYCKPQCGLACGRYVNSYFVLVHIYACHAYVRTFSDRRCIAYCVTPLYRNCVALHN